MKTLIIGMGEVGRALCEVLRSNTTQLDGFGRKLERPAHEVTTFDKTDPPSLILFQPTDVLNICYPYGPRFEEQVVHYIDGCHPRICIIHSTVPVGTTRKIHREALVSCNVVHSPVHGQPPRLVEGIRTFTKYVGSCASEKVGGIDKPAFMASEFLHLAGIKTSIVENAETSELSKLWCTAQTAMGILVQQEIHRLCEVHKADFREVYTAWNLHYNEGYRKLRGEPHGDFTRPIYRHVPGPLGGHCLFQNAALIDSWVTDCIRKHGGPDANQEEIDYSDRGEEYE